MQDSGTSPFAGSPAAWCGSPQPRPVHLGVIFALCAVVTMRLAGNPDLRPSRHRATDSPVLFFGAVRGQWLRGEWCGTVLSTHGGGFLRVSRVAGRRAC